MLQKLQKKIKEFIEEKGQGTVEYALLLGFVAVIAVLIFKENGLQKETKQAIANVTAQGTAVTALYESAKS